MNTRSKIIWWTLLVLALIGACICYGKPVKNHWATQGSGGYDLINGRNHKQEGVVTTIRQALPVRPLIFYFAATATDVNGLTSDYSNEDVYVRTGKVQTVTLAWDASQSSSIITNYAVWMGRQSRFYTTNFNASTNLILKVPLFPPALTNIVIIITTSNASDLAYSSTINGLWTMLNATNWIATNPTAPRYFRAVGKSGNPTLFLDSRRF